MKCFSEPTLTSGLTPSRSGNRPVLMKHSGMPCTDSNAAQPMVFSTALRLGVDRVARTAVNLSFTMVENDLVGV